MKAPEISEQQIQYVQKVSHKCYGWIMGREQAINTWCLVAYNKPRDIVRMNAKNIHVSSYEQIVRGLRDLGVGK